LCFQDGTRVLNRRIKTKRNRYSLLHLVRNSNNATKSGVPYLIALLGQAKASISQQFAPFWVANPWGSAATAEKTVTG
jgi:hypothetical protein